VLLYRDKRTRSDGMKAIVWLAVGVILIAAVALDSWSRSRE